MVGLLAVLGLVPAARAADPPPGVILDANVTVTVREAASDLPIAGALVRLVASVNDFPEGEVQSQTGTTGPDGVVTFSGVARAEEGQPPIHLAVTAHREATSVDENGCTLATSWDGLVADVTSAAQLAIALSATPTSSLACPPRPVLHGIVHDRAGRPIHVRIARASILLPSGGVAHAVPIHVAADGTFSLLLPTWGPANARASVTVRITGRVARHVTLGNGCVRDLGQAGSATVRIRMPDGELPRMEVVTREVVLGERCGSVGAPKPTRGASAPGPTLPATDSAASSPRSDRAPEGPSWLLVLTALGLAATVARLGSRSLRRLPI